MQKLDFIQKYIHFPFDAILNGCSFDINTKNQLLLERAKFGINSKDHNEIFIADNRDIFSFELKQLNFSDKKICIIICCKDNPSVLEFCLQNLVKNNTQSIADILIVDDRSSDNSLLALSKTYNTSYIRVDNNNNIFSFSALNNIAAAYCYKYGKENIIFWNSDVWADDSSTLLSILGKHQHYKADLTGIKLVYPKQETYQTIFGKYKHVLDSMLNNAFNTIQHGGIVYLTVPQFTGSKHLSLRPYHLWRYYDKNEMMASCDVFGFGVTGAFQLIDTELFINVGGYATSMIASMQDIDLCLRLLKDKNKILYMGSEFMYHAESITNYAENNITNHQIISDALIFDFVWNNDIKTLLGMMAPQFHTNTNEII